MPRAAPRSGSDRKASGEKAVVELARRLGALLSELDLAEVEVTIGGTHVRLARATAGPGAAVIAPPGSPVAERHALEPPGGVMIEAPMVGTFYRASSPGAEPYAREGDTVKQGQIICIIEAMKLMNEIEAKLAGRVVKIYPENAQPVEFGQPLFLIDPAR